MHSVVDHILRPSYLENVYKEYLFDRWVRINGNLVHKEVLKRSWLIKWQHDARLNFEMPEHLPVTKKVPNDHILTIAISLGKVKNDQIDLDTLCMPQLKQKQSSIPGAGLGLWNEGPEILKNTVVALYGGRTTFGFTKEQIDSESKKNAYLYESQSPSPQFPEASILIDAPEGIGGRYINDCRDNNETKEDCDGNNCKFTRPFYRKNMFFMWELSDADVVAEFIFEKFPLAVPIVTTRKIKKGEELFVSYGEDYWKEMK